MNRPAPDKSVLLKISFQISQPTHMFRVLNQHICSGYSKDPSQWDNSFEHPKHMFKLMDKKIISILR